MMTFEDKHPSNYGGGFGVTNEEPDILRSLLTGHKVGKVGGIASAGEVLFSVLLPKASKEIILVDHSYRSLFSTYAKAVMFEKLGIEATLAVFSKNYNIPAEQAEFYKAVAEISKDVPKAIVNGMTKTNTAMRLETGGGLFLNELRREWRFIAPSTIERGIKKLDKVRLIHGDLRDLEEYGKFDLIYASNAMEHSGRHGTPMPAQFERLLRPGGLLLSTHNTHTLATMPGFELLRREWGYRTAWDHRLYRRISQDLAPPKISPSAMKCLRPAMRKKVSGEMPVNSIHPRLWAGLPAETTTTAT
jgi:SAM-dependent methyltransferase